MDQGADVTPGDPNSPQVILGTARRVIESLVVAVGASAGLYLVGSVYTGTYYGRMSIEVTTLDLEPPYIALQSAHVLESLLEYPLVLLFLFLCYRIVSSRFTRVRDWYDRARARFGRVFLLIVNFAIVLPLLAAALRAELSSDFRTDRSIVGDVSGLMSTLGLILIIYLIWLSFGPRDVILNQIRQWQIIPIALLFALYLLDALIATSHRAALDAELLMTGMAESSVAVTITPVGGLASPLPDGEFILVTARNANYFVVERQGNPPSQRPVAYAIPFSLVSSARTQRINDANIESEEFFDMRDLLATPRGPA